MFNTIISVVCTIQTFVQEKNNHELLQSLSWTKKSHNCTVQFEAGEENRIENYLRKPVPMIFDFFSYCECGFLQNDD